MDDVFCVQNWPPSNYRFEEEGTQEWFCAKLRVPELPKPLAYRTRMVRSDGQDYISVEIVRPRPARLRPNRVKIVVSGYVYLTPETDWRDAIQITASKIYDEWDLERSKALAKQGENPYIGTFERGPEIGYGTGD